MEERLEKCRVEGKTTSTSIAEEGAGGRWFFPAGVSKRDVWATSVSGSSESVLGTGIQVIAEVEGVNIQQKK